jgi:hypothetical protein
LGFLSLPSSPVIRFSQSDLRETSSAAYDALLAAGHIGDRFDDSLP